VVTGNRAEIDAFVATVPSGYLGGCFSQGIDLINTGFQTRCARGKFPSRFNGLLTNRFQPVESCWSGSCEKNPLCHLTGARC
jgi:hypothetical protein